MKIDLNKKLRECYFKECLLPVATEIFNYYTNIKSMTLSFEIINEDYDFEHMVEETYWFSEKENASMEDIFSSDLSSFYNKNPSIVPTIYDNLFHNNYSDMDLSYFEEFAKLSESKKFAIVENNYEDEINYPYCIFYNNNGVITYKILEDLVKVFI